MYQFWQKDKKDEINASERKIGGADLGPVTQLFTENYMVRFLLENSLGAWWASHHRESALVQDYKYLRRDDEGRPAAGGFDGWPDRVADVTVMDPCCGSGHFLVEAFSMLWQMRAEEEGLGPVEAQDAVLQHNLFGLELDPRCVQIAKFTLALQAWKTGGGWRQLFVPNIACSGIPTKAPVDEWRALADGDDRLECALTRLHVLYREADTLGSLIEPKGVSQSSVVGQASLDDVDWDLIAPRLAEPAESEGADPATSVLGADAASLARATELLQREYVLVVTNVPFLIRRSQSDKLRRFTEASGFAGTHDLATVMLERSVRLVRANGSVACVSPQNWLYLKSYEAFRRRVLSRWSLRLVARLGEGGFWSSAAAGAFTCLTVINKRASEQLIRFVDASTARRPEDKAVLLCAGELDDADASSLAKHPASVISPGAGSSGARISDVGQCLQGISTGDGPRFVRRFWEVTECSDAGWAPLQSSVTDTATYAGRANVVWWEAGVGELREWHDRTYARIRGTQAWGHKGIAVSQMREVPCTLYEGDLFDNNSAVIVPRNVSDLPALWAFTTSPDFRLELRRLTPKISVEVATIEKVPFDIDHWRRIAEERDPLPEPWSDDPTQWLFDGRPELSSSALQVAVVRLLGYRWPAQPEADDLDALADIDGIVCLPAVAGEPQADERLAQLVGIALGRPWSPGTTEDLLELAGSKKKNLADWLRDEFFKQHCALFANRPFVWHICDGIKDGFSALVNYHRLDRKTLEKLTYTYLGQDWVERQRAGVRDDLAGAEARLAAALELQRKLETILTGEKPFDIYVRWKALHEQPVGWDPDLDDGVRVNIRPFVDAGVLRSPVNIHWKKDRGKNPDGTERHNDIHLSLAEKLEARGRIAAA